MPHPIEVLYGGGVALACSLDGELRAEDLHGLFAADTRVLSTYRITLGGIPWQLLGRSRLGHGTAAWRFQNRPFRDPAGDILAGSLFLDLRRRVDGALHDDLRVCSFAGRSVRARLSLQLDADFADIFEVKSRTLPPRLTARRVPHRHGLVLAYDRGDFHRGLRVTLRCSGSAPTFAGALVVFDIELRQGQEWRCCLHAEPEVDGTVLAFAGDPHEEEPPTGQAESPLIRTAPILQEPVDRGRVDLRGLAVSWGEGHRYVAAGVPWFLTLFGRDSLLTGLMAGVEGTWPVRGALLAVGELQARERDDRRDAEPGKLPHEVRRGELARLRAIPHTPYYGTHDAPSLYCLALWHGWRWTGDRSLLDSHLDAAMAALRWCEELGDRDGDGLQEYATRSPLGYYNQSWKDAGDAIVHEDGHIADLPLATVELQGYLYAARMAMAELFAERGDRPEAERLREAARELRALTDDRYWLPERGFYAMALDGGKRPVSSASSNPGHLLWAGLPSRSRARAAARRLLAPDLFSGWGLRTLSSEHPAYNPMSYQRGSVWPHDTMLAAAGLARYGLQEEASHLILAILEAALAFEDSRLPELFCGFGRSLGPPVPYVEANIPQAWAAAAPILAVQLFLGLMPDAPRGRCLMSPWLPSWLAGLEIRDMAVGEGSLDVAISREGGRIRLRTRGKGIRVVQGSEPAPLWGQPPHRE